MRSMIYYQQPSLPTLKGNLQTWLHRASPTESPKSLEATNKSCHLISTVPRLASVVLNPSRHSSVKYFENMSQKPKENNTVPSLNRRKTADTASSKEGKPQASKHTSNGAHFLPDKSTAVTSQYRSVDTTKNDGRLDPRLASNTALEPH